MHSFLKLNYQSQNLNMSTNLLSTTFAAMLANVVLLAACSPTPITKRDGFDVEDNNLTPGLNSPDSASTRRKFSSFCGDTSLSEGSRQLLQYLVNEVAASESCSSAEATLASKRSLSLPSGSFSDLSVLEGLWNLRELEITESQVTDLTPLSRLPSLKKLILRGNDISSIAPLKELTTLRVIDLGNNKISDLAEFSKLKGLKSLSLDGNEIAQLPRNAVFADLIEIDLSRNQIIDFSPETFSFPELRSLSVNENQLERVINLEHIKNLEIVNMSGNKLLKVDSQFGPKVRALDFSFNQIFDSAFLQQFIGRTELTFINLIGNLDNQGSPLRCPAEIQDKCLTL